MRATAPRLVGRHDELDTVVRLLDVPEDLPGGVVLRGEAGIGKTTVWLAGLDAAAERGYQVLTSRPSDAETGFSFSGLADLLDPFATDVLSELPPVQRRALEAALLLGDPDVPTDDRAVAVAFLEVVRRLSRGGPLCIAIDDVQWLDTASVAALRYALGRLETMPVAALLAVRGELPPWLRRVAPEGPLRTVDVDGLSVGATYELLRVHLDVTFPRPTLIKIWETSGGNPFFALELSRALKTRGGPLTPGEELPIPADLDELLRARLDALSASALEVAQVVACLAEPTVSRVEAAGGDGADIGLDEALGARILELDGDRLRFTHPLLGAAAVAHQLPSRRRALHARLATIVPTGEERSRHLALATTRPSRRIAQALEDAARSARARGAPAAAAELAEQAVRLTPAGGAVDGRRRLFLAAHAHDVAGDTERAILLLEGARDAAPSSAERAAILVQLADVQDDPRAVTPLYLQALDEAGDDDALTATIHIRLARIMAWGEGFEQGKAHADMAVHAASRTHDAEIRALALMAQGDWEFRAGRGIQWQEMEESVALERSLAAWPLDRGPTHYLARQLVWAFELGRGRALHQELLEAHRARNDADGEATSSWWLALLEWRAGNWEKADRCATDQLEIRAQLGRVMPTDRFVGAVIAAHRGRIGEARDEAQRELMGGEDMGIRISQSGASWVLGFVEWSLGDAAAALVHLRRAYALRNAFMLEPGQRVELGDLAEALIATGELEEANHIVETWQPRAAAVDRAWARAILDRCRALLLAAKGDLEGSLAGFDVALAEHARSPDPFHLARTLLALGRTQRRAKRRAAARETLEDALARFERLGAPLWAEQARAELARIGGRAPSRGELTQAEQRIAALVAEGRTNREVAAALFLTEHSVETTLTRVYRKLGVRSRAELTSRLAANS